MVAVPFLAAGGTGGDEADDACAIGMGDRGDKHADDETGGIFSGFGGVAGVDNGEAIRVGEDKGGLLKTDAMLGQIDGCLAGVPLKLHF